MKGVIYLTCMLFKFMFNGLFNIVIKLKDIMLGCSKIL